MEKKKKKRNKIIGKICCISLLISVLLSVFIIPCSADNVGFSDDITIGVPIDVLLYDVMNTNPTAGYIIVGGHCVYTSSNSPGANGFIDTRYNTAPYSTSLSNRLIDNKLVQFTVNDDKYSMITHSSIMGNAEITIQNRAVSNGWSVEQTANEYYFYLDDNQIPFDDYRISKGSIVSFKYSPMIAVNMMNVDNLPSFYRFTFYCREGIYNSLAYNNILTVELEYDVQRFSGGSLQTEHVVEQLNFDGDSPYIELDFHGDDLLHEYNEEIIIANGLQRHFDLSLGECVIDLSHIYEHIVTNNLETVISNLTISPYLQYYDLETGQMFSYLDNPYLLDYLKNDNGILSGYLPCYSYGFISNYQYYTEGTEQKLNNGALYHIGRTAKANQVVVLEPDFNILDWLGNSISTIMDIEIIGYITLGNILYVTVGISLFYLFLKMWAGG